MKLPNIPGGWVSWAGIGAGVAVLGYWLARRAAGDTRPMATVIGEGLGTAAANVVSGAATGVVTGAGAAVGIPATDASRCEAAKAAGDTWEASKYCPAPEFLRWSANKITGAEPPTAERPPTVATARSARPTLRKGDRSELVAQVQRRLGIEADGVFGTVTERGVRNFQARNGLQADGIVGPATWAALDRGDNLTRPWSYS